MGIVCASDPALVVGATHRVVHTDAPASLLAQLGRNFSISEASASELTASLPDGSSALGLVAASGAWLLEPTAAAQRAMPDDVPDAWRNLAPAVLQHIVLEPLLGINADVLAGGRAVTYTHHFNELLEAVQSGQASAAFVLPAPTLQAVIDTADAGSFMPQKSTYFVPKLPPASSSTHWTRNALYNPVPCFYPRGDHWPPLPPLSSIPSPPLLD